MKTKNLGHSYVVRLEKGEEIVESLEKFCTDKKIKAGKLQGLGALSGVTLGHYSLKSKDYTERNIEQPLEIVSLLGTITEEGIHAHVCVSDEEMSTYGGHLVRGTVAATCEVIIAQIEGELGRYSDRRIGLDLLDV